jgi:DNA-binding SARP family transcriptional activator
MSLLRHFELVRCGEPICVPLSGQRILAYLALREGSITRSGLAMALWPDAPEDRAMQSLRTALWRLHRPGLRLVEATPSHIALSGQIAVDFREIMPALVAIVARPDGADRHMAARLARAGELLPGWYDEWVVFERERFHQFRLHALESVCVHFTGQGEFALAIDMGLMAVRSDPLRETARRALIGALLAEGNRAEALSQYRSFRQLLRIELDVAPSERIDAMVRNLEREGRAAPAPQ